MRPRKVRNNKLFTSIKWGKLLIQILVFLTLGWIIFSLAIFVRNSITPSIDFFFLKDYPIVAMILAGLVITLYWLYSYKQGMIVWNSIPPVGKIALAFTLWFYFGIFIASSVLPILSNRQVTDDWVFLLIAVVPILLILVKLLVDRASNFKAKIGGVELEFQLPSGPRSPESLALSGTQLDRSRLDKGRLRDLPEIIDSVRNSADQIRTLVVTISDSTNDMQIDFLVLRSYVFQLSAVTDLQFMVFVDRNNKYLAFQQADDFRRKYPLLSVERVLQELVNLENYEDVPEWQDFLFIRRSPQRLIESIQDRVLRKYWDRQGENRLVKPGDLLKLGATNMALLNSRVSEAYDFIVIKDIRGVPVIDGDRKFLGIATRENLVDQILRKILLN